MAVKWMLQPSLLLRFRLSSLGAPCLSGGLEETASSQKAEFAAVLGMLRISLSLFLSFTRFFSTSLPVSQSLPLSFSLSPGSITCHMALLPTVPPPSQW